jgi:hypothetical protein
LLALKTPRSMRDLWKGNIYSHYYVAGEVPETFDLERGLNHHRFKCNSRQWRNITFSGRWVVF